MVKVFFYNNVYHYKHFSSSNNYDLKVKEYDFIRYLVALGSFFNKNISINGFHFYYYLVKMALDTSNGTFEISDDYDNSESTIKASISYFIGSISAYAIAEKHHNLSYLFHLKDPIITNIQHSTPDKKRFPDYLGLYNNNFNSAFLIEAKGTSMSRLSDDTISNAKSQVSSISSVDVTLDNTSHTIRNFERHVIGSYFKNKELYFCDIDPEEIGDVVYKFDAKSKILMYYKNVMFLLLFYTTDCQEIKIENIKYKFINFDGYRIGLNSDIFNYLVPYYRLDNFKKLHINYDYQKGNTESDLFQDIFDKSNEMYNNEYYSKVNQSKSLGRDGIIVF
ncbi:hypothetical protein [Gemella morbillorum]|uniref:hypothetical protein n=3 Tax=Bacilli TaxID=91061 RepID=UPI0028D741DF|nr:hypothetical protein [Gemella morbillorum]